MRADYTRGTKGEGCFSGKSEKIPRGRGPDLRLDDELEIGELPVGLGSETWEAKWPLGRGRVAGITNKPK